MAVVVHSSETGHVVIATIYNYVLRLPTPFPCLVLHAIIATTSYWLHGRATKG